MIFLSLEIIETPRVQRCHLSLFSNSATDTLNLTVAGQYNSTKACVDITIQNGYAYVADGGEGLFILDIINEKNISYAGNYSKGNYFNSVDVNGDIAYV